MLTCRPITLSHAFLEFYVDGNTLPLVEFDVGPSWAGLIPISGAANETRKVRLLETSTGYFDSALLISQFFFWLFPPGPTGSLDDFAVWYVVYLDVGFYRPQFKWLPSRLNGGPGCSSLEGLFQENGVSYLELNFKRIASETI